MKEKSIEEKSAKPVGIKVFFEYSAQGPGRYTSEDAGDYERESYAPGTFKKTIIVQNFLAKDIEKVFEMEDGDYDWNCRILFITDEKGGILFDSHNYKTVQLYQFYEYHDAIDKSAKELCERMQKANEGYKKEFDFYTQDAINNIKRLGGIFNSELEVE
jgi:hypothetical protein